jgi:hypothetical protein
LYICTYLQNLCALSSTGYWYNTYTQSFDRYRFFFYRNSQFLYRVIIIKTKIIWQSKTTMKRLNNFRTSYTCMHIVNVGHRVWNTLQRHPKLLKKEKCWKKQRRKSGMDNTETQTIFGTRHRSKTNIVIVNLIRVFEWLRNEKIFVKQKRSIVFCVMHIS